MSFYIDTSALVPLLVMERHTSPVMAWLPRQPPATVFISDWTHTEVSSALSIKVRTGAITLDQRAVALAAFGQLQSASLPTLAVEPIISRSRPVSPTGMT